MTTRISLVSLVLLCAAGCAREAAPAHSPSAASVSPYAHLESAGLWRDCDGHCGSDPRCIEMADAAFYSSGGSDVAYEEAVTSCERELELGNKPNGESPDVETYTIPAGSTFQLWELAENVGCGDPIASKREADGSVSYSFSCPGNP